MQSTHAIIQIVNLEGKIPYSLADSEPFLLRLPPPPPLIYFFSTKLNTVFLVDYLPWRNTLIGIPAESDFNLQGVFETDFQMAWQHKGNSQRRVFKIRG